MNMGHLVVRFYFLNSGNLICRRTDISMYFRESLGVRDNESRLYMYISGSFLSEPLLSFAYGSVLKMTYWRTYILALLDLTTNIAKIQEQPPVSALQ